jgi:hypothetical protein
LEPVDDFWNFFAGLTRELKLKSLASWVTSENVKWNLEQVPVSEIILTWDFPGLEFMPKAPFSLGDLVANKEFKQRKEKLVFESLRYAEKFPPRDHFPIVLFSDPVGRVLGRLPGYYVLEGNRRSVKAIVTGEKKINAFVGRFESVKERWPKNFWIPTGFLRNISILPTTWRGIRRRRGMKLYANFLSFLLMSFLWLGFKLGEERLRILRAIKDFFRY